MADFLAVLTERVRAYTPVEAAVARACFHALFERRPLGVATLRDTLPFAADEVDAAVARLVAQGSLGIGPGTGDVTVARGLSARRTGHALRLDGRPLHACCAVDAVGIPAALGRSARIESACHACHAPVAVTLVRGRVPSPAPATVIWAAEADLGRPLHAFT